ncbi:MAG: 30S ribosomal protein S3 [Holosporales bacterium]|jgi:small subunit ribosomal protein S3|nr:30S ribosomal protein S3 [Holosporales bacterium]
MGQKVNPVGMRLGILRTWESRWVASRGYSELLFNDLAIRDYIQRHYKSAGVARVVVERPAKKVSIEIYSSRPGVLIGKGGADLDKLRKKLSELAKTEISINVVNIRKPELDAYLIAEGIAFQIEKRVSYRRAMKRAMQSAMKLGALGIRVNVSGRLNGAEIARVEWYREGRVPLHTLRSDVDFSVSVAKTTYGTCGVKVWIYKGDYEVGDVYSRDKKV